MKKVLLYTAFAMILAMSILSGCKPQQQACPAYNSSVEQTQQVRM